MDKLRSILLLALLSLCGCPPDDPCTASCGKEKDLEAFAACIDRCEHAQPARPENPGET